MRTIKLCAMTTHRHGSVMDTIHRWERDLERTPRVIRQIPAPKPAAVSH